MSSYPKGQQGENYRASKRRKSFQGNQHTSKEGESIGASASARKLAGASAKDIPVNHSHRFRIIEFVTIFGVLSEMLCCKDCKGGVKFEESLRKSGFGWKLVISCKCGSTSLDTSPYINNGYELNRRMVFTMRLLGVGLKGINLFAGLMDFGQGLSKGGYDRILEHIYEASRIVFRKSCDNAIAEEKKLNEENSRPLLQLKVSGDGSWKKRGYSSKLGVTTLIGYETGKIVDLIVKSTLCQGCVACPFKEGTKEYDKWYENHADECTANHEGSAGKMEVDAVLEMFGRSVEYYGVYYTVYIGDGDSKTFLAILKANPYGDDFTVVKCECIGHVQKRMGTRLRNLKKAEKLGGKGKLTDALINKLSTYYGLAIRRNVNSVEGMKNAIMGTYHHLCSTDENPMHQYCPTGIDSWCEWQSAQVLLQDNVYKHPPPLHPDLQKHLLPIYEDLSKEDLLKRCLGGYTQNANESFNALVWRLAPKHLHCGPKTVEIAAYIAGLLFNDGFTGILRLMTVLEFNIGTAAVNYAMDVDEERVKRQNTRSYESTKAARVAKKQKATKESQLYEEEEGLLYGAGIAD